jgi:predicted XRE-type DNA-binding protein
MMAKLTEKAVAQAKKWLKNSTYTQAEIAGRLGVSQAMVSHIANGKRYAKVKAKQ